ncbi:MAG TPA: sigma-70 family RNA polymerase sigma factor [Thermomicrobiales bacterium]|nr:sigma-70 family RNA polymerase sigma factor [Thermomicrobiales bacterium]
MPNKLWSEEEERALAVAAKTDRAAFGMLYDRYVDRVYGYCFRRLQTREEAEDATSHVFTKALAALPRYRDDGPPFGAWLFTIARNVVIDEYRRRGTTPVMPTAETGHAADPLPGPEEHLLRAEEAREVRSLLSHLTADQAEVVELRLAGLTDKEIAVVVGRSPGAVRVAQHRAVRRLRSLLGIDPMEKGPRDA